MKLTWDKDRKNKIYYQSDQEFRFVKYTNFFFEHTNVGYIMFFCLCIIYTHVFFIYNIHPFEGDSSKSVLCFWVRPALSYNLFALLQHTQFVVYY